MFHFFPINQARLFYELDKNGSIDLLWLAWKWTTEMAISKSTFLYMSVPMPDLFKTSLYYQNANKQRSIQFGHFWLNLQLNVVIVEISSAK